MITGLKTSRGAVISIHFGKICTTNLWNDKWYEITDLYVIEQLKKNCSNDLELEHIRANYNPDYIGKPYVRAISRGPGAPVSEKTAAEPETNPPPRPPFEKEPEPVQTADEIAMSKCRLVTQKVLDFFSEFAFNPAARFMNTLALCKTDDEKKEYISAYVELVNNPDQTAIVEKMKSAEFNQILSDLSPLKPSKKINKRFKVFYGDAGTGKTTKAIAEYPDANVITCNSSILPDELMRTFDFNDANGNPVFKKSALREAMENGKPIIFDEINLLNFDCLRLLQTFLDGKEYINYNAEQIQIKDGFEIIGTMNLVVNEQVYSLPEPLVDRASFIKKFTLSADQLAAYSF